MTPVRIRLHTRIVSRLHSAAPCFPLRWDVQLMPVCRTVTGLFKSQLKLQRPIRVFQVCYLSSHPDTTLTLRLGLNVSTAFTIQHCSGQRRLFVDARHTEPREGQPGRASASVQPLEDCGNSEAVWSKPPSPVYRPQTPLERDRPTELPPQRTPHLKASAYSGNQPVPQSLPSSATPQVTSDGFSEFGEHIQ